MELTYRWLGVAGLELMCNGYRLLIDPHVTRPPKRQVAVGARVRTNAALVARHAGQADAVLISHPHYDHLLDVPEVLRITGACGYGSHNSCRLLALSGIPAEQIRQIGPGDHLMLGPFEVEVYPARHTRIPMARWLNGSLPRRLRRSGDPAVGGSRAVRLRLSDFRMDACYSFFIHAAGMTLLVGNYPVAADVLFIAPYNPGVDLTGILKAIQPREVVPIHWDDFFRPLDQPIRPILMTRAQSLGGRFSPVQRLDLQAFVEKVQQTLPDAQVTIPELFRVNALRLG